MFFELFKNALRAVVEHYGPSSENYPDVEALVVSGEHDVTVKVKFFIRQLSDHSSYDNLLL